MNKLLAPIRCLLLALNLGSYVFFLLAATSGKKPELGLPSTCQLLCAKKTRKGEIDIIIHSFIKNVLSPTPCTEHSSIERVRGRDLVSALREHMLVERERDQQFQCYNNSCSRVHCFLFLGYSLKWRK